MNIYHMHHNYTVRDRFGGEVINSSAGTTEVIRASNPAKAVEALVRRLQKLHNGVVTQLRIIKV